MHHLLGRWTQNSSIGFVLGLLAIMASPLAADNAVEIVELQILAQLKEAECKRYRPMAKHDLEVANRLFQLSVSSNADYSLLADQWNRIGFDFRELKGQSVWVLKQKTRRDGHGFYAFRPAAKKRVMLQAPHAFYDKHTAQICASLFCSVDALAAGWNTVHRSEVDLARHPNTLFQTFTRAIAESQKDLLCVQLHGFAANKRKTKAGRSSDLIVSNGTRHGELKTRRFQQRLQFRLPKFQAKLYPDEVNELGGTTNLQGRLFDQIHHGHFIHLEMSRAFRDWLHADRSNRLLLSKCIHDVVQDS